MEDETVIVKSIRPFSETTFLPLKEELDTLADRVFDLAVTKMPEEKLKEFRKTRRASRAFLLTMVAASLIVEEGDDGMSLLSLVGSTIEDHLKGIAVQQMVLKMKTDETIH